VLPYTTVKTLTSSTEICDTIPPNKNTPHIDPDAFVPSTIEDTSSSPESQPLYTESFVDANLPGGIFEKTPYLGFAVSMSGT
jgi:hypothetical protein